MTVEVVREVLRGRRGEAYDEWVDVFPDTGDAYVTFSGEGGLLLVEAGGGLWSVQPMEADRAIEVADVPALVAALDAVN